MIDFIHPDSKSGLETVEEQDCSPGAAYQQDAGEGADFSGVRGLARLGADLRIA